MNRALLPHGGLCVDLRSLLVVTPGAFHQVYLACSYTG